MSSPLVTAFHERVTFLSVAASPAFGEGSSTRYAPNMYLFEEKKEGGKERREKEKKKKRKGEREGGRIIYYAITMELYTETEIHSSRF